MRALLALVAGLAVACAQRGAKTPAEPLAAEAPPTERDAAWAQEALVIDVRDPQTFAAGHDRGALNLQLAGGQLETRVEAYVPERTTPIAIRAASEADAEEALARLERRGYTDVGFAADPGELVTLEVMTAAELRRRLAERGATPLVVLDVRTAPEWERGHIEGAVLLGQDEAPARVGELDPEREYAVICERGGRSSQFASLLQRRGFRRVWNVIDGMAAWRARE